MNTDVSSPQTTTVAPHILLVNHFKALKLPTFAREYEKVGADCAREGVDYPHYLLRLCELERIDREGATWSAASGKPNSRSPRVWTPSTSWPCRR